MSAIFVTGTDTNVGKTFVTAALARRGVERGLRVGVLKPAESGCRVVDGQLEALDALALQQAAGGWQLETVLYRFAPAVAPGVAADDEGVVIDFDRIARRIEALASSCDVVLVEGAGGWLVPLGQGRFVEDLVRQLKLPVLVVARAGLGTINHSLLTLEAVGRSGCTAATLVLSVRPEDDVDQACRNQREIQNRWPGLVVLTTQLDWEDATLAAVCST